MNCLSRQKVDLTKYIEETTFNFDYSFNEIRLTKKFMRNAFNL